VTAAGSLSLVRAPVWQLYRMGVDWRVRVVETVGVLVP
jgi:hypothetical protein